MNCRLCERRHYALGLCNTHWKREKRHGDPTITKSRREVPKPIILDDAVGIRLTKEKVSWIAPEDLPLVSPYIWRAVKRGHNWYAVSDIGGRPTYMHDLILPHEDGLEIDHVTGNGLWNFRWNLRAVSHSENMRNSRRCLGGKCLQKMMEHRMKSAEELLQEFMESDGRSQES